MSPDALAASREDRVSGSSRLRAADLWLAAALVAALSPGLVDLVSQWISYPWSRYSAVFAALLAWCVLHAPATRARPWLGTALIAAALGAQLLAALAGQLSVARAALAAALIGFLLLRGLAPVRVALLAVFVVPVPYTVAELLGGLPLVRFLFGAGAELVSAFGPRVELDDLALSSHGVVLTLQPIHAGLPLLVLCLGLASYALLRRSAVPLAPRRALRLAAGFALAGAFVEIAAVLLACVALAVGSAEASRFVLESLAWLIPTVVVVGLTERAVECRARATAAAASG